MFIYRPIYYASQKMKHKFTIINYASGNSEVMVIWLCDQRGCQVNRT